MSGIDKTTRARPRENPAKKSVESLIRVGVGVLSVAAFMTLVACGGEGSAEPAVEPAPDPAVLSTPEALDFATQEAQASEAITQALLAELAAADRVSTEFTDLHAAPLQAHAAAAKPSRADAQRFLDQATWGATEAEVTRAQNLGFEGYIADQIAKPRTGYATYFWVPEYDKGCTKDYAKMGLDPVLLANCHRAFYYMDNMQRDFFQSALTRPDQLRQRVAFALSQIIVSTEGKPYGLAVLHHILLDNAFGNYRDILLRVTTNPSMGNFLDMVNSDKPNPARGIQANENYARELMQLFSVGLFKLNPDGTVQKDAKGRPLPSFNLSDVQGLARAFTGWTYPTMPVSGAKTRWNNPRSYQSAMIPFEDHHDKDVKKVIGGVTLPANSTAQQDLTGAIAAIFNHPNVGPYIGKQLIQKLVTGNPSPAYVARVTQAFNTGRYAGVGSGKRGDLGATVRAVLLDADARGDVKTAADDGQLREPVFMMTSLLRALGGVSDGERLRTNAAAQGQNVFLPPSVFAYFPFDNLLPGTDTLSPEFGVLDTSTALARANFLQQLIVGGGWGAEAAKVPKAIGTRLDLTDLCAAHPDNGKMVDRLSDLLVHHVLPASERGIVLAAANAVNAKDADKAMRCKTAAFVIATSSQFQVKR